MKGWKQLASHAGLKHTQEWRVAWQWELHRYQMNDGKRKEQNGRNFCLCTKHRTNRPVGRPEKIWEGALNDFFLKTQETGETKKAMKERTTTHGSKWPTIENDESNGKWILNDSSCSICWQCAQHLLTDTLFERLEVGCIRGGEHRVATHQGPDGLWLIRRQSQDTRSKIKELKLFRVDEHKTTLMSETATLFAETLFLWSFQSEDSSVLFKFFSFFLGHTCVDVVIFVNSFEFVTVIACCFFSHGTLLHCLKQSTKSLLCLFSKAYRFRRFFWCGVMTPALMSVGPGFWLTLVTSYECGIVIDKHGTLGRPGFTTSNHQPESQLLTPFQWPDGSTSDNYCIRPVALPLFGPMRSWQTDVLNHAA